MTDFYDTIDLSETEVKKAKEKGRALRMIIEDFFRNNPDEGFTPFEVYDRCSEIPRLTPITSIRRAMTDASCMYNSVLVKTQDKRAGAYNTPNHIWRLRPRCMQAKLF